MVPDYTAPRWPEGLERAVETRFDLTRRDQLHTPEHGLHDILRALV